MVGSASPPFRSLDREEMDEAIRLINESGAAFLFVGLGSPKQENFAWEHRSRIMAVQLCVGAAFDFIAGTKEKGPCLDATDRPRVVTSDVQRTGAPGKTICIRKSAFSGAISRWDSGRSDARLGSFDWGIWLRPGVRDHRLSSSPDSEVAVIAQERPKARISHPGVLGGRSAWPVVALWFLGVSVLSFLPHSAKVRLDTRGLLHTPAHVLVFAASVFIARPIAQQSAPALDYVYLNHPLRGTDRNRTILD